MPIVAFALLGIVVAIAVGAWLIAAAGLLGTQPATSDVDGSGTAAPSPSSTAIASASASPSASVAPDFPTAAEDALLGLLGPRPTDECQRMMQEDAPRHFYPDGDGITRPHDISFPAGVDCALGGISGPDRAWLWQLPPLQVGGNSRAPSPNEVVSLQGSRVGAAPGGKCATAVPAIEQWSFGPHAGSLLCYLSETGDAVVMWTYDDETLLGKAIHDEGNMAALLAWWIEVARFGPS